MSEAIKSNSWVITLITIWLMIYDFITWPIYQLLQRPWERRKRMAVPRAELKQISDSELMMTPINVNNKFYEKVLSLQPKTLDTVWKSSVQKFGQRPFLGTRDILGESDEVQPNGKSFRKLDLGDYRWMDFTSVDRTADDLGRGLKNLGIKPIEDRVAILADTRMEFFVTQMACFKHNFPLVTLYTNLGEDAIAYGLNQTRVKFVVTTHELLPKFHSILPQCPAVRTLLYFENQLHLTDISGFKSVDVVNFWDVVGSGKRLENEPSVAPEPPKPEDTAIIMYTSGSTGVPKGVVHSHENIFHALAATASRVQAVDFGREDAYLGLLPLAHLFELIVELCMSVHGVRIGYASPLTFMDRSTMVKRGCKGDATLLRPTVVGLVPLILERLYKAVTDSVEKRGGIFAQIFNFSIDYRRKAHNNGELTPILDNFVLGKIRALLGGRTKFLLAGGAPLAPVTQDFVKHAFSVTLLQGYGLTETCGCTTVMDEFDASLGQVGGPNPGVVIKIVNWDEGNYRVTDKPNPRGEIISGGRCVAQGYFEMPEKTAEDFSEEEGVPFMRTGDIGEVMSNGTVKIIDRKKDLVKLQGGEYVSLGKVEACLKTCSVIDNVCVYGQSSMTYPVALVCPDRAALRDRARQMGKKDLNFENLCKDRDMVYAVLCELVKYGKAHRLEKFELPGALTLCTEIWTPENNFVTAALKLKRKNIQDYYQADLDRMYGASRGA